MLLYAQMEFHTVLSIELYGYPYMSSAASGVSATLLRNFTAGKSFVGGMYLIPLFPREGLGEILSEVAPLKIPLIPPLKRGKKKCVNRVQFLPLITRHIALGEFLAMPMSRDDLSTSGIHQP